MSLEGADGASIFSNTNPLKIPSVRLKDMMKKNPKLICLKSILKEQNMMS
jgi:hypothetical protein